MSIEDQQRLKGVEMPSLRSIQNVELPDSILEVVDSYEAAGGQRDRFLWQWIYDLFPAFTLSCVPSDRADEVRRLKTELTIFVTLLDDLAEREGDSGTFEAACRAVVGPDRLASNQPADECEVDTDIVAFAEELWNRIDVGLHAAPRHDEFRAIFEYDLRQVLNAMDYSRVLNDHPEIANIGGVRHYDSHNMVVFPYTDVDIMYSPGFDPADFGPTRGVLWDLQRMARIGNWLTTWKREVHEGDYSSGVVVYALQHGLITPADLESTDTERCEAVIERIETCRIEEVFRAEWRQLDRRVAARDYTTQTVDLDSLVEGMETVMAHHLATEGHK